MIKGVNKRIVEVRLPESEYFERALMFLRGDILQDNTSDSLSEKILAGEAAKDISRLEEDMPPAIPQTESKFPLLLRIGFWAAALFRFLWHTSVIVCAGCLLYTLLVARG